MNSPGLESLQYALCFHCARHFDRAEARWCDCIARCRTGVCPTCDRCSCAAPAEWVTKYGAFTLAEPETETREEARHDDDRPVVLVAEDDRVTRTMLCRALMSDYRVVTAHDGIEALMQLYAYRPAIIVSDALMPGLDGRAVSRQVKSDPRTRGIKVVLITSLYRDKQYEEEAKSDFHVDAFLRKPILAIELKRVVQRLLGWPLRAAV
ncbi:MAG: response regulator [Thermoanaerobaculia bacterium]|jgi:CheY-like chemotaxis protein